MTLSVSWARDSIAAELLLNLSDWKGCVCVCGVYM